MAQTVSQTISGSLDVRMMRTLLILLTECSVSRTADILGQTQPTVSLALKRLRAILGDPLLVRSGSRLVPTARGIELRGPLRRILDDIAHHMTLAAPFDPATSKRHYRIVSSNCLGTLLLPRIVERMRSVSPGATLEVCPLPKREDLVQQMADGDLDLVIGNWPSPPGQLRMGPLLGTDIVCMMRPRHPLARSARIDLETYLQADHLSPSTGQCAALNPIGGRLLELNLSRKVALSLPDYGNVPAVLAQTDLLFTTGRPFAEHLASMMPFSVIDAPPELGSMHLYMLWHDRNHRAADNRWLRELVRGAANELKAIDAKPREQPARTRSQAA